MMMILMQTLAAALGTIAFSVLYGVPRRYFPYCGTIGAAGWLVYSLLMTYAHFTPTESTFLATVLLILIARFAAVTEKCPATIFVITGIVPLVPGAGIYWTSYYLVTGQMSLAIASGFAAIKAAFAIVIGIVAVFELPYGFFDLDRK